MFVIKETKAKAHNCPSVQGDQKIRSHRGILGGGLWEALFPALFHLLLPRVYFFYLLGQHHLAQLPPTF